MAALSISTDLLLYMKQDAKVLQSDLGDGSLKDRRGKFPLGKTTKIIQELYGKCILQESDAQSIMKNIGLYTKNTKYHV